MDDLISRNKLQQNRPEWLNENCVGREEQNKGWNACNEMWLKTIAEQPTVESPTWILCSERLPEGCENAELEVLVCTKEKYIEAEFDEAGFALYYPGEKKFRSV